MNDVFNGLETANLQKVKAKLVDIINRYDIFNEKPGSSIYTNASSVHLQNNCVFAGGFFSSSLLNEEYNDIDLFILNSDRNYYQELLCHYNKARGDLESALSPNVFSQENYKNDRWTFRNNEKSNNYLNNDSVIYTAFDHATRVQYILTRHKSRQELLADFDMSHCTVSYVHGAARNLYITRKAFDAIKNRKIIPHNRVSYGKMKLGRMAKLIKNGWVTEDTIQNAQYQAQQSSAPVFKRAYLQSNAISTPTVPNGVWSDGFLQNFMDKHKEENENLDELLDRLLDDVDSFNTPWDLQTR